MEPEQQHVNQTGGQPGEERTASSVASVLKPALTIFTGIGGVLAVVALVFAWTILGSIEVKSFATAGLILLVIAVASAEVLRKDKKFSALIGLTIICTCLFAVCATIVAYNKSHLPATNSHSQLSPVHEATIKFDQRGTAATPLPVACRETVPVSGRLPRDYSFAVGNVIMGNSVGNVAFVPESSAVRDGGTWHVPVTFGVTPNAGSEFEAYLVVIPQNELNYLVTESQQTRAAEAQHLLRKGTGQQEAVAEAVEQSGWTAPGLPRRQRLLPKSSGMYERCPAVALSSEAAQERIAELGCLPSGPVSQMLGVDSKRPRRCNTG